MSQEKNRFRLLPYDRITTAVNSEEIASDLIHALEQSGFQSDKVFIRSGEAAKEFLDLDGSRHGFLSKLVRKYQTLSGTEAHMIAQMEAVLAHDRYLVFISVEGMDEEHRSQVLEAILPYTKRTIYYCSKFEITIMHVGSDHGREAEYEEQL